MRIIERLRSYLEYKHITPYAFERTCKVANGYFGKQGRGKGTIGSDILERIYRHYTDLDLVWLITGEGDMLATDRNPANLVQEIRRHYTKDEMIQYLNERIALLEKALSDKEKIIALLESGKAKSRK